MAPNPRPIPSPALNHAPFNAPAPPSPIFPTAALGPLLSSAVTAVATRTQAPPVLVAHHILTLAAMAAQRLISVRLPTGARRPVSCFFASLVGAGEGRGAAEKAVVEAARAWERGYEETRARSIHHLNLFYGAGDPRAGARYLSYTRQAGLFARHPHDLVQPGPHRRGEAAALCDVWNGTVLHRAAAPPLFPRLCVHLVAAPRTGRAFLGDADLMESGLLGRMLVASPASCVGTRTFTEAQDDKAPAAFGALLDYWGAQFEKSPTADSRVVGFSRDGASAWLAYVNDVERSIGPGGAFAPIRTFACHLPEHAARLAAVIAFMNDGELTEIGRASLDAGIALARFYAEERFRLHRLAMPELSDEEKEGVLREWLQRTQAEKDVTLRDICRIGPKAVRNADTAYKLMRRMERLGIVQPANTVLKGASTPRRAGYAWHVEKEAAQNVA